MSRLLIYRVAQVRRCRRSLSNKGTQKLKGCAPFCMNAPMFCMNAFTKGGLMQHAKRRCFTLQSAPTTHSAFSHFLQCTPHKLCALPLLRNAERACIFCSRVRERRMCRRSTFLMMVDVCSEWRESCHHRAVSYGQYSVSGSSIAG